MDMSDRQGLRPGMVTLEAFLNAAIGHRTAKRPYGRFYAEDGGEDGGSAATTAAEAGTEAGQAAEGATEAPTYDPNTHILYERRNLKGIVPDGDPNKVGALAKQAQEFERAGYMQLRELADEYGVSGFQLRAMLESMAAEGQGSADDGKGSDGAAAEATGSEAAGAGAAGAQASAAAAEAGQAGTEAAPLTADELQKAMTKLRAELKTERQAEFHQFGGQLRTSAQLSDARRAEAKALSGALDTMGLPADAKKVQWVGGKESEVNIRRVLAESALKNLCQQVHEDQLDARDPEFDRKATLPWSPETVQRAASLLAPHLKELLGEVAAEGGDAQDNDTKTGERLPTGSLAGGRGGRAQKRPEDMSPDELNKETIRRAKAKVKAAGGHYA